MLRILQELPNCRQIIKTTRLKSKVYYNNRTNGKYYFLCQIRLYTQIFLKISKMSKFFINPSEM